MKIGTNRVNKETTITKKEIILLFLDVVVRTFLVCFSFGLQPTTTRSMCVEVI